MHRKCRLGALGVEGRGGQTLGGLSWEAGPKAGPETEEKLWSPPLHGYRMRQAHSDTSVTHMNACLCFDQDLGHI